MLPAQTPGQVLTSLPGVAWGLSLYAPSFAARNAELTARGMPPCKPASLTPGARAVTAFPPCHSTAQPGLPPARAAAL